MYKNKEYRNEFYFKNTNLKFPLALVWMGYNKFERINERLEILIERAFMTRQRQMSTTKFKLSLVKFYEIVKSRIDIVREYGITPFC